MEPPSLIRFSHDGGRFKAPSFFGQTDLTTEYIQVDNFSPFQKVTLRCYDFQRLAHIRIFGCVIRRRYHFFMDQQPSSLLLSLSP